MIRSAHSRKGGGARWTQGGLRLGRAAHPRHRWLAAVLFLLLAPRGAAAYDWLQFNGDPQHSGNNLNEKILGASNVARLALAFQVSLPAVADGAPVFLRAVPTASGVRDLVFLTTKDGHILALDGHTGEIVWSHQYPAGSCRINSSQIPCFTTSSPAIDPSRQHVYGYGLDGYVHKYQVGDGTEITTGGWPQLTTLKGFSEKGSSALSFATAASGASYLYVSHGGYPGDAGDYQGHLTAIRLSDGSQRVFNALCSDQAVHFVSSPTAPSCSQPQSAIWARAGVVYDSASDRIFMATGNGLYDGNTGGHEWGDSVFALNPDGTGSGGKPLDSYTPTNYNDLQNGDLDLGSSAPAILPAPTVPGRRFALQAGKDKLRLIDLLDLSSQGGPGHVGGELQTLALPQGGVVLTTPAVWINPADGSTWAFIANSGGLCALKLTFPSGVPTLAPQWVLAQGGASPLVANGVLYYARPGSVIALDPLTGNALWSDSRIGGIHWESPVVANGMLYIADESSHLTAYLLGQRDFNADGKTDILWRHTSGAVYAWLMNGTAIVSGAGLPSADTSWKIAGNADFNGDGRTDILWRHTSGANYLWLMNGTTVASGVGLPSADPAWSIAGTGDFNGDGQVDILWRHTTGATYVWLMNGTTVAAGASLPSADPSWTIAGTGDFNGDGQTDILWRHTSGAVAVWFLDGVTVTSGASLPSADPSWTIAGTGDFNGDGRTDILWRHTSGANYVWLMSGTTVASGAALPAVDTSWSIAGPK